MEILQVYQARSVLLKEYAFTNHKKDMEGLVKCIENLNGSINSSYIEKVTGTKNIDSLINKSNKVNIRANPDYMNTVDQINFIVQSLLKLGFKPYKKIMDCGGVFLSHIIVPGLEKFNCIQYCVIAPGKRGQKLIDS